MKEYNEIEEIKNHNGLSRIQNLTPDQLKHLRAEPKGEFHPEDEIMTFEKSKPLQKSEN